MCKSGLMYRQLNMGWMIKKIFLLFCLLLLLPVFVYASFKGLYPPMEIEPELLAPSPIEGMGSFRKMRSKESIKEELIKNRERLDFIYKKALKNNPTLKGEVVIEFTIAESGEVKKAHLISTAIKDPTFEDQLLKRILSWKFPSLPDSGDIVVSYPIQFSPV